VMTPPKLLKLSRSWLWKLYFLILLVVISTMFTKKLV
jgi:hypothetical protein